MNTRQQEGEKERNTNNSHRETGKLKKQADRRRQTNMKDRERRDRQTEETKKRQ